MIYLSTVLIAVFLFYVGLVLQAFLMARDKRVFTEVLPFSATLSLLVGASILFSAGKIDASSLLSSFVFGFLLALVFFPFVFAGLFTFTFKQKVLPPMGETTFFSVSLAFAYSFLVGSDVVRGFTVVAASTVVLMVCLVLFFEKLGFGTVKNFVYSVFLNLSIILLIVLSFLLIEFFTYLLLAACVLCVLRLLSERTLEEELKPVFYSFFLAMLFSSFAFIYGSQISLLLSGQFLFSNWLDALASGMLFTYLGFFALQLFELVPLQEETESIESMIRDWREHLSVLASKFSNKQLPTTIAIALIVLQIVLLAANHFLQVVEPRFAVEAMVLLALTASLNSSHENQMKQLATKIFVQNAAKPRKKR